MIQPTPGRIVHYHPTYPHSAPLAAIVAGVHDARSVNLLVIHDDGSTFPALETILLQDDDKAPGDKPYAEWMAFQKGQAPASSAVEERLKTVEALLQTDGAVHQTVSQLHERIASIEQHLAAAGTPPSEPPTAPQEGQQEAGQQQPAS